MPRVLVVDDDQSNRAILKRMLTSEFEVEIVEAANGLEALDALARGDFSLVLLDARMPVLDGVEALEAIRQSPDLAALRVCMMTVDRKEALVLRALELGVADFVLKPLTPRVLQRLRRLVAESHDVAVKAQRAVSIDSASRVLIVDDNDDFRAFFCEEVGRRCSVSGTKTGVEALQSCLQRPPDAVFMADQIGLFDRDRLARKLRALDSCRKALLIAIASDETADGVALGDPYDGVLVRSFDRSTLLSRFRFAVGSEDVAVLNRQSPIMKATVTALRQASALLLDLEMQPASVEPDGTSNDWRGVRIELQGPNLRVGIEYGMPTSVVRSRLGVRAGAVDKSSDAEAAEAVKQIALTAAGRLVKMLRAHGTDLEIGAAQMTTHSAADHMGPRPYDSGAFQIAFVSSTGNLCGRLTLRSDSRLTRNSCG